jgi:hypothetical protein
MPLSSFAFDFKLRRYMKGIAPELAPYVTTLMEARNMSTVRPGSYWESASSSAFLSLLAEIARRFSFKLSVGVTCDAHLLEIEGVLTQGSRPGRTSGGLVDEVSEMDRSDWSCGIRHQQNLDTRSDTDFKWRPMTWR